MGYHEILHPSINSDFIIEQNREPRRSKVNNTDVRKAIEARSNQIEI
jgi:hypothetical protein